MRIGVFLLIYCSQVLRNLDDVIYLCRNVTSSLWLSERYSKVTVLQCSVYLLTRVYKHTCVTSDVTTTNSEVTHKH